MEWLQKYLLLFIKLINLSLVNEIVLVKWAKNKTSKGECSG